MILETLLRLRHELYRARNRNEVDDETLNHVLTLLDVIEIIVKERSCGVQGCSNRS